MHRIGEKGSQESERTDLRPEPDAIVIATTLGNKDLHTGV